MRIPYFLSLLSLLSSVHAGALPVQPSSPPSPPSREEIGYFADADDLPTDSASVPKLDAKKLPEEKRQFCSRTNEQIALPLVRSAYRKMHLWEINSDLYKLLKKLGMKGENASLRPKDFPDNVVREAKLEPGTEDYDKLHALHAEREADLRWLDSDEGGQAHMLTFENPDGSFGTGLCWFHSRFQRAAMYLARFLPDKPRPIRSEGVELIEELIAMDHVVEIPGFKNLREFSEAYKDQIIQALDDWSIRVLPALLVRLGDARSIDTPSMVRDRLEKIYQAWLRTGDVVYVRYNLAEDPFGFASHSSLILYAGPLLEDKPIPNFPAKVVGYAFLILDSNDHKLLQWKHIRFDGKQTELMRSYVDYEEDLDSFHEALANYCR